ncbi:MAG TPA: hypothetical protein VGD81_21350, partial [Opitutaceae bacterium]
GSQRLCLPGLRAVDLPAKGAVTFVVFMPAEAFVDDQVEFAEGGWYLDEGRERATTLTLSTATTPGAPRRVQAWIESRPDKWGYLRPTVHLAGLDGLTFCRVGLAPSAEPAAARATDFVLIAPENGYEPSLSHSEGQSGPVYLRTADGHYGRMGLSIDDLRGRKDAGNHAAILNVGVYWSPAGRGLYYCHRYDRPRPRLPLSLKR